MRLSAIRQLAATGKFTLVISYVVSLLLWGLDGKDTVQSVAGWLCTSVITLALAGVYSQLKMIRIRSFLLPSLFLLSCTAVYALHRFDLAMLGLLLFLPAQYALMASCQKFCAERYTFHAFLFLGLAVAFVPPLAFFVPVFFIALPMYLNALTLKSLSAAIIGLLAAVLLIVIFLFAIEGMDVLSQQWHALSDVRLSLPLPWHSWKMVCLIGFLVLLAVSVVHYQLSFYYDKIHIRYCYFLLILQNFVAVVLLLVYPLQFDILFLFFLLESMPLAAHLFVLGKERMAGVSFAGYGLLLVFLVTDALWMHWLTGY